MSTRFTHLAATVSESQRDLFVEICWELGSLGLLERESARGILLEATFAPDQTPQKLRERFLAAAVPQGLRCQELTVALQESHPDDWIRKWKAEFKGFAVGDAIYIHPEWEPASERHLVNLLIEPGHAFGTGTHESTQLCLLALQSMAEFKGSVLDVGTGSGILSMAAAKLWPEARIFALDNDPLAVEMAQFNLSRNGVSPAGLFVGEPAAVQGRFEGVMANLTLSVFRATAAEISRVATGWALISGFTREQAKAALGHFQKTRPFAIQKEWTLNDWSCLLLR